MIMKESYSVRCLFKWEITPDMDDMSKKFLYEERITVWDADSFDKAVTAAEAEAHQYAEDNEAEYLEFAQAFQIYGTIQENGLEYFSLQNQVLKSFAKKPSQGASLIYRQSHLFTDLDL